MAEKLEKTRKTLVQLASETKPKDPAAFAKHQVTELDKTAKNSMKKRKHCHDQIEADLARIKSLDDQIAMINTRYIPLCESLEAAKERRDHLLKMLESGLGEEKQMMTGAKGTVRTIMTDESKMSRTTASHVLESCRGFTLGPESTFHQSRGRTGREGDETGRSGLGGTGVGMGTGFLSSSMGKTGTAGGGGGGGVTLPKIGK